MRSCQNILYSCGFAGDKLLGRPDINRIFTTWVDHHVDLLGFCYIIVGWITSFTHIVTSVFCLQTWGYREKQKPVIQWLQHSWQWMWKIHTYMYMHSRTWKFRIDCLCDLHTSVWISQPHTLLKWKPNHMFNMSNIVLGHNRANVNINMYDGIMKFFLPRIMRLLHDPFGGIATSSILSTTYLSGLLENGARISTFSAISTHPPSCFLYLVKMIQSSEYQRVSNLSTYNNNYMYVGYACDCL